MNSSPLLGSSTSSTADGDELLETFAPPHRLVCEPPPYLQHQGLFRDERPKGLLCDILTPAIATHLYFFFYFKFYFKFFILFFCIPVFKLTLVKFPSGLICLAACCEPLNRPEIRFQGV